MESTRPTNPDTVSGLRTCVTHRYQDLGDTPPSVGGVDCDRAALSGRVGGPGRGPGDRGGRTVRGVSTGCASLVGLVSGRGPSRAGWPFESSGQLPEADRG